ncbi:hypothetical protein, partial [Pseudoalteromonas sp. Of11M-6]|uniref:hypothetical protein n=1 Tax=Pseudoalteromonas sp. Of11M-6 TaxID=2917754 RepID=UPI001EF4AFE8
VLTLFMMDSPNNCVCNYQFGALTPIWERPSHHPPKRYSTKRFKFVVGVSHYLLDPDLLII